MVKVIAEIGVNHNGDKELAKKLVLAAKEAGADIVKFQAFHSQQLSSTVAEQVDYQVQNTQVEESQLDMLKKLELRPEEFVELKAYCDELGIEFLATPFDETSLKEIEPLVNAFKIGSGEITNTPFLKKIAELGKAMILSTGMSTIDEIRDAVSAIESGMGEPESRREHLTLLHCTTNYPCPMAEVNLKAMRTLAENFDYAIGYSDHTVGIEVPVAAVALGAEVIEKHFTLDRELPGPDHRASMEPGDFAKMVEAIRNTHQALGSAEKRPTEAEVATLKEVRKSIVLTTALSKGEEISYENIGIKRPGYGIPPGKFDEIVGRKLNKDKGADELLMWEDLEAS